MKGPSAPIVLIDRDLKGVGLDGVFQDNYNISVECVETLIRAGHSHIATIAGPISSKPGLERLNGYMDALCTARARHSYAPGVHLVWRFQNRKRI